MSVLNYVMSVKLTMLVQSTAISWLLPRFTTHTTEEVPTATVYVTFGSLYFFPVEDVVFCKTGEQPWYCPTIYYPTHLTLCSDVRGYCRVCCNSTWITWIARAPVHEIMVATIICDQWCMRHVHCTELDG